MQFYDKKGQKNTAPLFEHPELKIGECSAIVHDGGQNSGSLS